MEHQQKGIAKKANRRYHETRLVIGVSLILLGAVLLTVLTLVWSQFLFPLIFNSRLLYRLILDKEGYSTCSNDFKNFVINNDSPYTSIFSFYIFNVSNPSNVIQRGDRPFLQETGPFSFHMETVKYDIGFNLQAESTTSYKEYSTLDILPSTSNACKRQFLQDSVSCVGASACKCHSDNRTVTVVNPLFAKTLWTEGGTSIIAHLAGEVFTEIKQLLENE